MPRKLRQIQGAFTFYLQIYLKVAGTTSSLSIPVSPDGVENLESALVPHSKTEFVEFVEFVDLQDRRTLDGV